MARRLKVKAASIAEGCRNMAVLVEGTMHERGGHGMREELVCRLCVLSAGRMAAEERLCHSTHGWVMECAAHLWGFLGWMARMAGEARNV